MSFAQLKPEIWSHIISFLTPTLSKPLSGCTKQEYDYYFDDNLELWERLPSADSPGTVKRKDIRAQDLAVLMRTSVAFNDLASYSLYSTVITDSFVGLVKFYDEPRSHPCIRSKAENLGRIRSLHLEYRELAKEPSYVDIMEAGRSWHATGAVKRTWLAVQKGYTEVIDLTMVLMDLQKSGQVSNLFTGVFRLTLGAIFGGHDSIWRMVEDRRYGLFFDTTLLPPGPTGSTAAPTKVPVDELITHCMRVFESMFFRTTLEQYCTRTYHGPLAPTPLLGYAPGTENPIDPGPCLTSPQFTMHLANRSSRAVAAFGKRSRWVLEKQDRSTFTTNEYCAHFHTLLQAFYDRIEEETGNPGMEGPYQIEAYASSSWSTPVPRVDTVDPATAVHSKLEDEEAVVASVTAAIKEERRQEGLKPMKGFVSWQSSPRAPPCLACRWRFEAEVE